MKKLQRNWSPDFELMYFISQLKIDRTKENNTNSSTHVLVAIISSFTSTILIYSNNYTKLD